MELYRKCDYYQYNSNEIQQTPSMTTSSQQAISNKLIQVCQKLKFITQAYLKLKHQLKDKNRQIQNLKRQNSTLRDISTFRNPRQSVNSISSRKQLFTFHQNQAISSSISLSLLNKSQFSSFNLNSKKIINNTQNSNQVIKQLKNIQSHAQSLSTALNKSSSQKTFNPKIFSIHNPIMLQPETIVIPKIKINSNGDTYRKNNNIPIQNNSRQFNYENQFDRSSNKNINCSKRCKTYQKALNQEQHINKLQVSVNKNIKKLPLERNKTVQSYEQQKNKVENRKDNELLAKIWRQRDKQISKMEQIWNNINKKLQKKQISSILYQCK